MLQIRSLDAVPKPFPTASFTNDSRKPKSRGGPECLSGSVSLSGKLPQEVHPQKDSLGHGYSAEFSSTSLSDSWERRGCENLGRVKDCERQTRALIAPTLHLWRPQPFCRPGIHSPPSACQGLAHGTPTVSVGRVPSPNKHQAASSHSTGEAGQALPRAQADAPWPQPRALLSREKLPSAARAECT
ncbi:hypothetical protein H8959_019835 [Pygathrix nigripes]